MPKLAQFDPQAPSPQPIIGWYDTDALDYPNLPPENALLVLTDDEWEGRLADPGGWTNDAGTLVAAPPRTPSLADQALILMVAGLAVTSTATPALDGTYACDQATQQRILAETVSLLQNGTFADGADTVDWPDIAGTLHRFDIAQFKQLNTKIAGFVAGCVKVMTANAGTLPAAAAEID